MDYFSIFEISKKLGIAKGKIYYKLHSDNDFKLLFTKDLKTGSYVSHKDNIESIGKYFNLTVENIKIDSKNDLIDDTILQSKDETISILKDEIDILKSQLIEKDLQISKLLQISQNNQVLLLEEKLDSNLNINGSIFDKIVKFFKRK